MKCCNPRRMRTQNYAVGKGSGYSYSGTSNGRSNGKSNSAGRTPATNPMPNGDKDAKMGNIYKNN